MRWLQPRYLLSAGLLAAAALLSASGCADNNSMMFVRGVIALDQVNCVAKNDPSNTYLPYGVLDTGFRDTYTAYLLVGNQLTARTNRNQLRTEPNRISIRGAVVSLTVPTAGGTWSTSFSESATGFVDPATGDTPGYGLVAVDLIPGVSKVASSDKKSTLSQFAAGGGGEVVADVSVFGDSLGGTSVTSNSLTFPVYVCTGCLVNFPPDAIDPSVSTTHCSGTAPSSVPCQIGQDVGVDCRLCIANPLCAPPASLFTP